MAHIHDKPGQHDLAVSMYIIRTDLTPAKAVLHQHKKFKRWMPFGGHVELNENPWQAVRHELLEETGYELSQLTILQPKDRMKKVGKAIMHPHPVNVNTHPAGFGHFHTCLDYAFTTTEEPLHEIGEGESTAIKFFEKEELAALSDNELFSSNREAFAYIFDICLSKWDRIAPSDFS